MASTNYDDTLKNASGAGPSANGESLDFNMDEQEAQYAQRVAAKRSAARDNASGDKGLLKVQPLRKQDMQVSYAQSFDVANANNGFYGSLMNCLGVVAGSLGQLPCCICCVSGACAASSHRC